MKCRVWRKIAILAMCMTVLMGCDNMKFDQVTDKSDLLTEKYSITQVEELKNITETRHITYEEFKKMFDVECMRKTHQGYYVVLLLEDDRNAFAFFNQQNTLTQVLISNGFKSKNEFQNYVTEKMPKSEVLKFDTNTINMPISAVEITTHIVQEGLFVVKYARFDEGVIEDPIVESISFIENEAILESDDSFLRDEIPYILEIDKVSE